MNPDHQGAPPVTATEAAAFNAGVSAVLALARRAALAIEERGARPLHHGFAAEALRALADEAEALLLPASAVTSRADLEPR